MKISSFSIILSFVVLMLIGTAMVPLVNIGEKPQIEQRKNIIITYGWPNMAAKVVEQNVTSTMEGVISSIKGVERVSSTSYFGGCEIQVTLKRNANPNAVKFEIASLLRQTYEHLPQGVWYPWMGGGEMEHSHATHNEQKLLLSYEINADMPPEQLKNMVEQLLVNNIRCEEDVNKVEVTGTREKYIEINYNPQLLAAYHLTPEEIGAGINNFIGRDEIVGDIVKTFSDQHQSIIPLHLTIDKYSRILGEMPIKKVEDKIIYLNDLASFHYKYREPDNYYRINGKNTVNLNIYVAGDSKLITTASRLRNQVTNILEQNKNIFTAKLATDASEQPLKELQKVIYRSLAAILILLLFVLITSQSLKCLAIVSITLLANILISIIGYVLCDVQLNVYSLAGITIAMGLIIDSVIIMTNHYSYYHNRKAFLAILAALLTTIGSLIVIFFLPKEKQDMLYDFSWVIIINLITSLVVALLFVPALVEQLNYIPKSHRIKMRQATIKWNRFYTKYIYFACRHRAWFIIFLIYAFGIPIFALPDSIGPDENVYTPDSQYQAKWYEKLYNNTFGSDFFIRTCKDPLTTYLGGSMYLFSQSISDHVRESEQEKILHISGKMPSGSTAAQLNEKVILVENYLREFNGIKEFTTQIFGSNAVIDVTFKDDIKNSAYPYQLEKKLISKLITIGGADWKTYGVSYEGFSNSIYTDNGNHYITISGFNFEQLNHYAEDMAAYLQKNRRISDIKIEIPGFEHQEDEYYIDYNTLKLAIYNEKANTLYHGISPYFKETYVGKYTDDHQNLNIFLKPIENKNNDLWHLNHAQFNSLENQVFPTDYMNIYKRNANNFIPRENQEFIIRVSFNIVGSYMFISDILETTIKHFNRILPLGYKCDTTTIAQQEKEKSKYGLIILVVVIIFFICSIQFDSIKMAIVVVSMIPVSLIGTFLTFYFTSVEFGDGGFASLIMLCGITVNAMLYIITQYLYLKKINKNTNLVHLYTKAINHKIVPVLLTIISTILGLVPFFFDGQEEIFWFSFATGVTGGLLFSVISLLFVCPIFLFSKNQKL